MNPTGPQPLRRMLAAIVAVQLLIGVVAAAVVSPTRAVAVSPSPPAPAPRSQTLTSEPGPFSGDAPGETQAADAVARVVPIFKSPGAAEPFKTLTNPTWEGVPLVLHVLEDGPEWLHVRVNIRPNGTTAWVRRVDVAVRPIANRIVVELAERRLTVLHGNTVLAQHRVAIGAPNVPTPTGEFYVDATVHIRSKGGPYGAGQLSVSGFSNVLYSFGGGIGQIAIHGTNNPGAIGGTVSHGCIRMLNDAWEQVVALAPNGTPVSIRP